MFSKENPKSPFSLYNLVDEVIDLLNQYKDTIAKTSSLETTSLFSSPSNQP